LDARIDAYVGRFIPTFDQLKKLYAAVEMLESGLEDEEGS
jgi:hypothetical protein